RWDGKRAARTDSWVRRRRGEGRQSEEAGVFRRHAGWGRYVSGDTFSAANAGLVGRVVDEIARERNVEPFDALVDIVTEDDFRTVLWPMPTDNPDAPGARRPGPGATPRRGPVARDAAPP